MLSREMLKNGVFLMPFPEFLSAFLCIGQMMNEKKIFRNMNKTKPKQEDCPTLK